MTISATGKTISPRQKHTKLKGDTTVEVENNQGSKLSTDKIEPTTDPSVKEGETSEKSTTKETLAIAAVRPVGSSDLQVAETVSIAGIRPISASDLQVIDTFNAMGVRPIGANTLEVVSSINLSGIRPIASSSLVVAESYSVFGNRPVASNDIDNPEGLMGYLD
ncbi:hypothetical protein [Fortiea contorta]|uniref:hypothetical protein n=1 Tax=Fortiea contorta TaxID=1892405 RepID=UPI000345E652|nr:hypothetical protein [Fortiea contorta]